jgi:hypothetical protein
MKLTYDRIERETDQAVLVKFGDEEEWIPKSQILNQEFRDEDVINIPVWLAEGKGLEGYEA